MSNYTPGPWSAGILGNPSVYGPDGMGEHSGLIARVFKGRANVQLIGAAPDLLEALKDMIAEFSSDEFGGDAQMNACWKAKQAVAKAEGRS